MNQPRPAPPLARRRLLAAVALLLLAGCRGETPEDPPLKIATLEGQGDAIVADSISAGLTARDARGAVIPGIAQSWRVSDDGLSLVFRLRDARFADGRVITATDAAASVRRVLKVPPAGYRGLVAGIRSVSAPVANVVEVTLTTPQPEVLELLAEPAFAIRPGGHARSYAGPFVQVAVEKPAPGHVRLQRQPTFHAVAEVQLAAVEIIADSAPDAAIARFRNREADIVTGGGLTGMGAARALGEPNALRLQTSRAALMLLVNQRSGPLADRRVRTALSMAIDRNRLGPLLFGSAAAQPVAGISPPTARSGGASVEPDWIALPMEQRLTDARRLLTEAGHGPEAPLKLVVSATDQSGDERLVTMVGEDLARIGVSLTLGRRSPRAHAAAVARGAFELALVERSTPIASPVPFLVALGCGNNRHGVCLAEADRLLAESWKAGSTSERLAMLASAERLWAEDAAVIGLVQPLRWSLVSERVGGWSASASPVHPLRFLSFDPDRKLLK